MKTFNTPLTKMQRHLVKCASYQIICIARDGSVLFSFKYVAPSACTVTAVCTAAVFTELEQYL